MVLAACRNAFVILAIVCIYVSTTIAETVEYEIGGPLAGVKLPKFPTQHGEAPGYPGSIPALVEKGEVIKDMGNEYREWGPQGMGPEWDLYPGSVEHWRAYMFKYMPIRSFFDRQSQLKNWVAPNLPGVDAAQANTYAEPVVWVPRHGYKYPKTGKYRSAVPVVKLTTDSSAIPLDLGTLEPGLYTVRLIGAAREGTVRPFRDPLFVEMSINDGLKGKISHYRVRAGYCDQFYSVANLYFHAPTKRAYQAELKIGKGSKVELLVHNISLDDVLAGTERRAIKTRRTREDLMAKGQAALEARKSKGHTIVEPLGEDARLKRDAQLWRSLPAVNAQSNIIGPNYKKPGKLYGMIPGVDSGTDQLTDKQIVEQHGSWHLPGSRGLRGYTFPKDIDPLDVFIVNPKLNLIYTYEDLHAGKSLPDPYPLKDDGAGLFFPDPDDPARGSMWGPIGYNVHYRVRNYYNSVGASIRLYGQRGEVDHLHDAALMLVAWSYQFPAREYGDMLHNTAHEVGPHMRDLSVRRRGTMAAFLPGYPQYVKPIMYQYDQLFDYIQSSDKLAASVGRFVPWVKVPRDVVKLIDTYLVQTTAKRIMRYHYHTDVVDIANLASVVGDTAVTDPWMEWLFSRSFIYPLPTTGVQDAMISGTTREGTETVGSTYYAQEEGAARIAASLDQYQAASGNPKYDLSDQSRYPKPVAHVNWRLDNIVAGGDFLRIGDVCGPDKVPGHTLRKLEFARHGWRWTQNPKFAFIIKHYLKRETESDDQWSRIEKAAATVNRAPWLDLHSRVLPMWAGILETGHQHDDYRFRRAAYLRVGYGMGHHHYDTLDLQFAMHGLPMTVDGGQRPSYSVPADRTTRIHNVVEVDGRSNYNHSWVHTLADHAGARYLHAEALPSSEGVNFMRRQITLIDVDEGSSPREEIAIANQRPRSGTPDKGLVTPNSYIFDVFRVDGGKQHTYCFHGPLHDDFQWNAKGESTPDPQSEEGKYLSKFSLKPEMNFAGEAPSDFEATWRYAAWVEGPGRGVKEMLGPRYDPDGPRYYTKLHLLGLEDHRALRGQFVCRQWGYEWTNAMIQCKAAEGGALSSAYAAIIEPYADKPFITEATRLAVKGNGADATRAVAVQVKTVSGRTDLCFSDGQPNQKRQLPDGTEVSGEYAFASRDAKGLCQATLVGGTLLKTNGLTIKPDVSQRTGKVTKVDYLARKVWIDEGWPAQRDGGVVMQIGLPEKQHLTTYTSAEIEPSDNGTMIRMRNGADHYRSAIEEWSSDSVIVCKQKPMMEFVRGNRDGWVASNDDMTKFWRAEYLGKNTFRLYGSPAAAEDFGKDGIVRLWEYGVGDQVSTTTSVSLRRTDAGYYELSGNVGVTLLTEKPMQVSEDGKIWQPLGKTGKWTAERLLDRPIYIKM